MLISILYLINCQIPENIHTMIKNNNGKFNLSEEQLKLAAIFT